MLKNFLAISLQPPGLCVRVFRFCCLRLALSLRPNHISSTFYLQEQPCTSRSPPSSPSLPRPWPLCLSLLPRVSYPTKIRPDLMENRPRTVSSTRSDDAVQTVLVRVGLLRQLPSPVLYVVDEDACHTSAVSHNDGMASSDSWRIELCW
jgi:hypothetical protein